jgi:hypothetical protein
VLTTTRCRNRPAAFRDRAQHRHHLAGEDVLAREARQVAAGLGLGAPEPAVGDGTRGGEHRVAQPVEPADARIARQRTATGEHDRVDGVVELRVGEHHRRLALNDAIGDLQDHELRLVRRERGADPARDRHQLAE